MHFRYWKLLLGCVLTAVAAAGCDSTATVTTPTTPGVSTTESFSGSISVNGAVTYQFTSSSRGTVTATLTTVGPDTTLIIGVSLGTWNGTSCQVLLANDAAAQGATVLGTVSGVGNLCLRVYDVGKLTGTATYTVDVTHP
jgi:hypothetical protein